MVQRIKRKDLEQFLVPIVLDVIQLEDCFMR